ncbi:MULTISPECIES: dTDP-4-dehydrorhamnose reductase [unclassified Pseudomonas]|jgi:dTDP-4-dehydrorhamnose reductase|uniref:dTDP-4-dehydrorhamnose reductase n=1 Tax=unclassified Pseudomonas TaxID=196821 RepID=UPI000EA9B52A|nr:MULTISPECIES: dTDP-4-dehydrorhamnose reductase [unclassified Pseudomonas]AYF89594.1 dTDP-4-dehydrorhamnose reductase [Pseudomonas sp. DY-1]MDH4656139.1 dTDP-4-dehydrorhamnose reductase [Pseudomonas sp. BN606]MRK21252.1 dTDP-4-dehydrorhamnose reductase [Pseudomonas sp. JG-B]
MKILVNGSSGQVARELKRVLAGKAEVTALGRDQLDLADPEQIRQRVRGEAPDLLINAAAHTAVDLAESEPEAAFALNATAPRVLAEEAAALGIPLFHYSTDYVFNGSGTAAYTEADAPHPLGVYGQSKLAGEQAIQAVGGQYLILRTSWVYSLHGRNFLLTMQRLLQEREELRVVDDQVGAPTWAGSIAQATSQLIDKWQAGNRNWGIYHLTNQGETSWFGFASAIADQLKAAGKPCARLVPIPSSEYPTPAKRPLNSRLDGRKLAQDWQVSLPDWRTALAECLRQPR